MRKQLVESSTFTICSTAAVFFDSDAIALSSRMIRINTLNAQGQQ